MTTSTVPSAIDLDAHVVERAEPALLHEHRNAGADFFAGCAPALEVAPAGPPSPPPPAPCRAAPHNRRSRKRYRAERVEAERIGHRALGDQIAAADFDGVDADLGRDGVDQPLAHKGGFVAAGRTIGAARRLVGQPDMADARDRPARDRGRAAWRRRDPARWRRACACRRRCRGRIRRRCRECGRARRWPRGVDGAAGANDWRRSGARAGPRSI